MFSSSITGNAFKSVNSRFSLLLKARSFQALTMTGTAIHITIQNATPNTIRIIVKVDYEDQGSPVIILGVVVTGTVYEFAQTLAEIVEA